MDKNELKIQALLEKIGNLSTQYENQVADLRVEITLLSQDKNQLQSEFDAYKAQVDSQKASNVSQEDSAKNW